MFYKLRKITPANRVNRHTALPSRTRRCLALVIIVSMISVGLLSQAQAEDCVLDPTFGSDGWQLVDFFNNDDRANDVVIQPNGRIIVVGSAGPNPGGEQYGLTRYNPNGSIDTSFSGDGKQTTTLGRAEAAALQPDGKIVAVGNGGDGRGGRNNFSDFTVARYNPDGSLDRSFSGDGKVVTDFLDYYDSARDVAIQPDGKIVVAGFVTFGSAGGDFGLARYHSNGALDTSFDQDGKVITDILGGSDDDAAALVLQPDGKIVVAGDSRTNQNTFDSRFTLARYNSDGSLDTTFGHDGKVTTGPSFNGPRAAHAVALQSDGKIVAAGIAGTGFFVSTNFCLVRYNSDGSLDTSFDTDGIAITDFHSSLDSAQDVIILPNNKIVAVGYTQVANDDLDFGLARYNSDGTLDTDFYEDGRVTADFFGHQDVARAIALQSDGKLIAVGYSDSESGDAEFAIARFLGDSNTEPILDSLTLTSNNASGCEEITGTVTLCKAAPAGGVVVNLSSTNPAASVPPSVTIQEGQTSAEFIITTQSDTSTTSGNIIARLGTISKSTQLVVQPVGVLKLSLSPSRVRGPGQVTGTVTLDCPAPAGGVTVALSSINQAVARPTVSSITIPEGSRMQSFTVQAFDVPAPRSAIIKATANGVSKIALLRVN